MPEKAILIGLITPQQNKRQSDEYLDELSFLAQTAGAEPVRKITQRLNIPTNKTFIGKGKIDEVKNLIEEESIELVIFDDDLSPVQLRNI